MNNLKEIIRKFNMVLSLSGETPKSLSFITFNDSISQQTIIANLAIMYAKSGENVLILDTDFSKNVFLEAFNVKSENGLSDYLNDGSLELHDIVKSVSKQNVSIIGSGSLMAEETKYLIGDPRFKVLLNTLVAMYDRILINTEPLNKNNYAEVEQVLKMSDGVILTIERNTLKKRRLFKLVNEFKNKKINLLGYLSVKR